MIVDKILRIAGVTLTISTMIAIITTASTSANEPVNFDVVVIRIASAVASTYATTKAAISTGKAGFYFSSGS